MATDSQTKSVSRLEDLPAELRRQILSILDFKELRTLIHASPTFHFQYRLDRRYILCNYLDTTLGNVAVDAYVAYQSSLHLKNKCSREIVVPLIKGYRDRLSTQDYSISSENLDEEQLVNMVTFQSSVVQPLIPQFTSWAWANLAKETITSYQHQQPLSKTEEIRILRAFYRYQLCCNIFGIFQSYNRISDILHYSTQVFGEFMNLLFEPWEIEEIICIFAFVPDQYDQMFNYLGLKVQEGYESPLRWKPPPSQPEDPRILQDSFSRYMCLTGTASCGLEILYNILFKPRTQTQLVSIVYKNIRQMFILPFFENTGFLSSEQQMSYRMCEQSDRNLKMQRAEPLPFNGDNEQGPPLAWTLIWQGIYSNLYGYVIPDEMRLWAYIMWDAERLEYTGAKEVLVRQFTTKHPRDPRIGQMYLVGHNDLARPKFVIFHGYYHYTEDERYIFYYFYLNTTLNYADHLYICGCAGAGMRGQVRYSALQGLTNIIDTQKIEKV